MLNLLGTCEEYDPDEEEAVLEEEEENGKEEKKENQKQPDAKTQLEKSSRFANRLSTLHGLDYFNSLIYTGSNWLSLGPRPLISPRRGRAPSVTTSTWRTRSLTLRPRDS